MHRVLWAVPALYLVMRAQGYVIPTGVRVWGAYLVMGALNNAIPFTLIFWGQIQIESGLASILNATTAVFGAVVAGILLRDEPLLLRKIIGAGLGVLGVAVVLGVEVLSGLSPRNLAQLAVLAAALSYAFASVWGKRMLGGQPPQVNAFGMVAGSAILMVPAAIWVDGVPRLDLSWTVWGALWGVALLSTALAYVLYFAILVRAGAGNLMLVTLMIPPFAIGLGAAFLGEKITPEAWIGFALIGVGLVVTDGRLWSWVRRRD